MPSFFEFSGESESDRRQRGSIAIQGEYVARRKPGWLVVAKLAIVMLVVGFAYALALRHIDLPAWQVSGVYFGVVLVYCGVAYLVRPQPNDMNMGWCGGLMNDPTQYSDNINRHLRNLECLLQPGQLATESLLDLLILCGVHQAYEPPAEVQCDTAGQCDTEVMPTLQDPPPVVPLPPVVPPLVSPTTGRVLSPDRFGA